MMIVSSQYKNTAIKKKVQTKGDVSEREIISDVLSLHQILGEELKYQQLRRIDRAGEGHSISVFCWFLLFENKWVSKHAFRDK